MNIGEIFYLDTDPMWTQQQNDLWLKVTGSPRSTHARLAGNARPFIYLQTGHSGDWGIWVPITTAPNPSTHDIPIPMGIATLNGNPHFNNGNPVLQPNSVINYKEIWEIPNVFISNCEKNIFSNGTHKIIDLQFIQNNVLPKSNVYIQRILNSYPSTPEA